MDQLELFFSYSEISEITAEYEKVDSISDMLECLEGATREIRRKGLCGMYKKLFEFSQEINQEVESSIVDFSKCLIDQGGLSLLIHHLSFLTSRICTERDLVLEQELRMLLGIIYTSLVVLPLEFIQSEVSQHSGVIEESLLVIVKLSTEACFVPIKKVCMVLYRYLEIILDSPCKHDRELGPRARASQSAVEGFYVNFM